MENKKHLSVYGIGPAYVFIITTVTAIMMSLHYTSVIYNASVKFIAIAEKITGTILFIIGIVMWACAVFKEKIDKNIISNKLVTTGVYRFVRNPIYSGVMFINWSMLMWTGNLYLLIPIPFYHLLLTLILIPTEEKWLKNLYREEYEYYCKNVNRCIPFFPKRKK